MHPLTRQPIPAIRIRDMLELQCYHLSQDKQPKQPSIGLTRFIRKYQQPINIDWAFFDGLDVSNRVTSMRSGVR